MATKRNANEQVFMNTDNPRLPLWVKLAICFGIGIILAVIAPLVIRERYLTSLRERIQTIAYLISPEQVASLPTNTEASQQDYDTLKTRLTRVKSVNEDARFLYIMSKDDKGTVRFQADSEDPGTDGFSPRGQEYPEASSELIAMFDNGQALIEGPVSDRWGSWLSILAPIKSEETGKVVGVVGLDIPSTAYYTLLATVALIPLVGALMVGSVIYAIDRARRKRLDILRMRGQLVSIASNELRPPINGIRWGEELLMTAQLGEREAKTLASMHESTLQLQDSIEDMLQLSTLQSTATAPTPHRVTTNLIDLISDIISIQQLPAQQKGVSIELGQNWPALAMSDIDQIPIKRAISNLISNAIKYSPSNSKVTIDYELIEGDHVFTIQDSGIGIPKSEQSKVFEGFYRASNAVKQGINGTGMGLYLSRGMAEQHGGKLWLSSSEGKGTTIYLRLPAKR